MPYYPYGSLPGEIVGLQAHVTKRQWFLLRKDSGFMPNWKSSKIDRPYHIAVSCLTRGLSTEQMVTVVRIWHQKHGHTFYEDEFMERTYPFAADYAAKYVYKYEANKYWEEVRRIAEDPKARQHSKMRVAYYLMNTKAATAKEIHERTNIPLKTVRNCLGTLQNDGKVVMTEYGVYRAVPSFHWDRAVLVGTLSNGYTLDDHPAMLWWGQKINERYSVGMYHRDGEAIDMLCYDSCNDKFVGVLYDDTQKFKEELPHPTESEWVINQHGEVVENGTGFKFISVFPEFGPSDVVAHLNDNEFDFRSRNLSVVGKKTRPTAEVDVVDFYSLLVA